MADLIEIKGIRAMGKHGVYLEEKQVEQPFDIDLSLEVDLSKSASSDDLVDTIDYSQLNRKVCSLVKTKSFNLIEKLAQEILHLIMDDARVEKVSVSVSKPEKLLGATPSVTLSRTRKVENN